MLFFHFAYILRTIHYLSLIMQKNRMHVSMSSTLITTFDDVLVVGQTYDIENFSVTTYTGKYKCVEGDSHIIFTHMMTATRVTPIESLMLKDFFDFTHLSTINDSHFQENHCIGIYFIEFIKLPHFG